MWLYILVFFLTFGMMEFMAWFTHKYIMHGFLWSLHKDHHRKDHDSWFERNDTFFIFYALISIGFFLLWRYDILEIGLAIGLGIFAYGLTYFMVHDI
ncbi:MAG: beta-carotene hydroxylase, partial [Flavobacterium sp.]